MQRKTNFQNLAFFWDLYNRDLLNLDPPYQRRSIWTQRFKDYFIDTVINNFPCPAIFLYEEISPTGTARYNVVDGKQRLVTCFEFIKNKFKISEEATVSSLRGKFFKELGDSEKLIIWRYQFAVEFVPQEDERLITEIFDRINRNVARLTRQKLRHAKYYGEFMEELDIASDKLTTVLPSNFPIIAAQSKRQMKDTELIGNILLLLEQGPRSYSQDQLDFEYSERDEEWTNRDSISRAFSSCLAYINDILESDKNGIIVRSRLRNQADFYSLFGAINKLLNENRLPAPPRSYGKLKKVRSYC